LAKCPRQRLRHMVMLCLVSVGCVLRHSELLGPTWGKHAFDGNDQKR